MPAMVVIAICLAIDFFSRVALWAPEPTQPDIDDVVTVSDAIPRLGQRELDSYLVNIDGLLPEPTQSDSTQLSDRGAQRQATEPADGLWRVGVFSYKLIALVGNTERFAVVYSEDNATGARELLELRLGDNIAGYTVSEVLAKKLRMASAGGDQVTLTLFEPDEPQSR